MEYEIKRGIKIPEKQRRRRIYPWMDMNVGDCFDIPANARNSVSSSALNQAKRHGTKFVVRKIDEKTCRVWRVK